MTESVISDSADGEASDAGGIDDWWSSGPINGGAPLRAEAEDFFPGNLWHVKRPEVVLSFHSSWWSLHTYEHQRQQAQKIAVCQPGGYQDQHAVDEFLEYSEVDGNKSVKSQAEEMQSEKPAVEKLQVDKSGGELPW